MSTNGHEKIPIGMVGVGNQFPTIALIETGESFSNITPDQVLVIGTLANGFHNSDRRR
jgi:hypothetical protein